MDSPIQNQVNVGRNAYSNKPHTDNFIVFSVIFLEQKNTALYCFLSCDSQGSKLCLKRGYYPLVSGHSCGEFKMSHLVTNKGVPNQMSAHSRHPGISNGSSKANTDFSSLP